MPRKTRLSDLQLVVLAHAARREDGHVLPLPATIHSDERTANEIAKLIRSNLVAEAPAMFAAQRWRGEGEEAVGLVLTGAGRTAIGVADPADSVASLATDGDGQTVSGREDAGQGRAPAAPAPGPARRSSKRDHVVALLTRPDGASVAEVCEETGWLPHSARAFLTGLRKQGHTLARERTDGVTRYSVVERGDAQG